MFSNHAYSIVGSDEENVYLVNPHDTSKTYTVSRKALAECGGYSVESFDFNFSEPPENVPIPDSLY